MEEEGLVRACIELLEAAASGDREHLEGALAERAGEAVGVSLLPSRRRGTEQVRLTALTVAVANGQDEAVRLLLARGADPNSQGEPQLPRALDTHAALVRKDSAGNKAAALFGGGVRGGDGVTPLILAAVAGHRPTVQLLLEAKAEVDAAEPSTGATAFHVGCYLGHTACVEALVEAGCDTSRRTEKGNTGEDIVRAKRHNPRHKELLHFLEHSEQRPKPRTSSRQLSAAAAAGDIFALAQAIVGGADLEGRDGAGMTALLHACRQGQLECLEKLMKAGADATAIDQEGSTALMLAVLSGHTEIVHMLLPQSKKEAKDSSGMTALLHACSKGDTQCMTILLAAGCDASAVSESGRLTALMLAAISGSSEAVQQIGRLPDRALESRNERGFTALLLACDGGHTDCIRSLAAIGCSFRARTEAGQTALMLAARSAAKSAVEEVLDEGSAELEARDAGGYTAFLWACLGGDVGCMDALVRAGCDRAAADSDLRTGLICAAANGHAQAVEALLGWSGGGKRLLDARDVEGMSAFMWTVERRQVACMLLLMKAGCDATPPPERRRARE